LNSNKLNKEFYKEERMIVKYRVRYPVLQKKIKKKNKLRKYLYRLLFLILLILLLMMIGHFNTAIEHLIRLNAEQGNMIHMLEAKVHNLEVSNTNMQIQEHMMRVKINGMEIHSNAIHNVPEKYTVSNVSDLNEEIHNSLNETKANMVGKVATPVVVISAVAATLYHSIKLMTRFVPSMP
jgi:hypothetical protein